MQRMINWVIFLWVIYLLSLVLGCGRSGRDLSDEQWLGLQAEMQQERTEVGQQRDQLESDRRDWDSRERSEPVIAATITASVLLVCCVAPLVLMAVLLWPRKSEPAIEVVNDLLIEAAASQVEDGDDDIKRLDHSPKPDRLPSRQA